MDLIPQRPTIWRYLAIALHVNISSLTPIQSRIHFFEISTRFGDFGNPPAFFLNKAQNHLSYDAFTKCIFPAIPPFFICFIKPLIFRGVPTIYSRPMRKRTIRFLQLSRASGHPNGDKNMSKKVRSRDTPDWIRGLPRSAFPDGTVQSSTPVLTEWMDGITPNVSCHCLPPLT